MFIYYVLCNWCLCLVICILGSGLSLLWGVVSYEGLFLTAHLWGTEEVSLWLERLSLSEYKEVFTRHDIRGCELLHLERRDLKVSLTDVFAPAYLFSSRIIVCCILLLHLLVF